MVITGAEADASLTLEEVFLCEPQVKSPAWSRGLHEARVMEGGEGRWDHPVSEYFTALKKSSI